MRPHDDQVHTLSLRRPDDFRCRLADAHRRAHVGTGIAPGEFDAFYRRLVERSERKLLQIARKFAEGGFGTSGPAEVPAAAAPRAPIRIARA